MNPIEITGQVFGRLTVLSREPNDKHRKTRWRCVCECSKVIITNGANLKKGDTKSCGCLHGEITSDFHRVDKSNMKIGKLQVIRRLAGPGAQWQCRCDCGAVVSLSGKDLNGIRYNSCGCMSGMPRSDNLLSLIRSRYKAYVNNAAKKNRTFELTLEQFTEMVQQPCTYCGDLDVRKSVHHERTRDCTKAIYKDESVNGVDRIDSNKVYTLDNTVSCCRMCNKMKMEWPVDRWLKQMERILKYKRVI